MNRTKVLFRVCQVKGQIYRIIRHVPVFGEMYHRKKYGNKKVLDVEVGRRILKDAINQGKPFMAARFGTSEGCALNAYLKIKMNSNRSIEEFPDKHLNIMTNNAGFFPGDKSLIAKWAEYEIEACKDLDLLGTMNFLGEEFIVREYCNQSQLMPCSGLASSSKGWAHVLEGKKVLVVHPFSETIISQYNNNRERIFPGTNALPKFDLKVIKAVQTIADSVDDRFENWFNALDYMTEEISKQDFDVALLGCGAYGFMLASRIKRMGKIAVHMGGSLQTLFGIKCGRWDVQYSDMYNDAWVYPLAEETPKGFEKVEGGCYWNKNE